MIRLSHQLLAYACVGAVGALINMSVYMAVLAMPYFHHCIVLAGTLAFSLAVVCNFIGNRYWTFAKQISIRSTAHKAVWFVVVSTVVLGVNVGLLHMEVSVWGWDYRLANLVAIGACSVLNFTANRLWTFA